MSKAFVMVLTVSDNLGAVYSSDVDGNHFYEKFLDCKMLISRRATILSRPDIPRIALQIMMTMAVCIASCERSFSKLKLAR